MEVRHLNPSRLLLRDRASGLFFDKGSTWVGRESDAMNFASIRQAVETSIELELENVELVIQFPPRCGVPDVALELWHEQTVI